MKLWGRENTVRVNHLLDVAYGATMRVESPKGTKKIINLAEIAILDGLDDELGLLPGLLATAAEINRVCDVSTRLVTLVASGALDLATHGDKTLLLGEVGGDALLALTLPAATGTGTRFKLIVSVVNTSSYTIARAGSDTIRGVLMGTADSGDTVVGYESGAAALITLNGSTKGGAAIGDWVELEDILTGVWSVRGQLTQSGSEASPFS